MDKVTPKDWLGSEAARNKESADIFTQLLVTAYGPDYRVLIGHHLCFQQGANINTENEVPAADSLIFDHDIMRAVFGNDAISIMQTLAALPAEKRDHALREAFMQCHCE